MTLLFEEAWRGAFPGGKPLAYCLREPFQARWVRFHSLPESKRYADDAGEMATILQRHNAIATDLFGEGGRCFMIQSRRDLAPGEVEHSDYDAPIRECGLARAFAFVEGDDPEDSATWAAHAAPVIWSHGAFDSLLERIATGEVSGLMWMNAEAARLLAPYDGGVDVFLPTTAERDALKARHASWLSPLTAGL